jgi:GNAT superfamily N-acetyltransferase
MTINLRPATETDKWFCRRVHHEAYRDVVTRQFGRWDEAMQDAFFDKNWALSPHQVVELDGSPVGCFSREIKPDHIFLAEVQLLPEYQNRGIGSSLVRQQQDEGAKLGVPVRLRVLKESRARRLYERLGLVVTGETETHTEMEWTTNKPLQATRYPRA